MESLMAVVDNILARKWHFLAVFFLIFSLTYGVLFAIDFLPETPSTDNDGSGRLNTEEMEGEATTVPETMTVEEEINDATISTAVTINSDGHQSGESLPSILTIPSLDRRVAVLNPSSRSIADLDAALLHGLVRHPDSATLAQEGNIFILGHSSYLPNVLNRNFQALNGIQNLVWGDTITLETDDVEYIYQVKKVYKTKATGTTVPIAGVGKKLTLATCNSFGSTDDRYIVEADLVETRSL